MPHSEIKEASSWNESQEMHNPTSAWILLLQSAMALTQEVLFYCHFSSCVKEINNWVQQVKKYTLENVSLFLSYCEYLNSCKLVISVKSINKHLQGDWRGQE